jgi:hypothetical protein
LKRALFFEAAGAVSKIGRYSFAKSLKHTVALADFTKVKFKTPDKKTVFQFYGTEPGGECSGFALPSSSVSLDDEA